MNQTAYSYINLQSLKEETFGDKEILNTILELFVEGIDEYLATIEKELPTKNWQPLFQETHKIKPNIAMFGIASLVDPILELETCFRKEMHLEKIDDLVELVVQNLIHVKKEIQFELNVMSHG
ncbi:Hpt domain-containing protein [Pontimicrobium aquaticum]|uniref:Hpt domain-containing protein n=1 Tax=Pontimicrobium aquaticum TaxID=2565367 RepID=UPI00145F417E|nr:Hpt domain-containing protein [Pontimicrobium aquaticum]